MQVFKSGFPKKLFFCFILTLSSISFLNSLDMPTLTMPEFPEMPDVTSISISDDKFYRPEIPSIGKTKQPSEKQNLTPKKNEASLSSAETTEDLISSFLYGNNVLTAKDIASLSDVGMFDSLSNLQGTNYSLLSQTSSNDVLLRQILLSLEDLKKEQSSNAKFQSEKESEIVRDSQIFKRRTPSILRFTINGYDLLPTLSTVFFSETEDDGSFLFTGDRKYYADKKNHTETFYILFRAEKSPNKALNYKICPSVIQNSKNENSFLYQMAQKNDITASKTGNLVVIHYAQNNWNMDLLLDIDCKGNQ